MSTKKPLWRRLLGPGALIPGGQRAINYARENISRDVARLKEAMPDFDKIREAAQDPLAGLELEPGYDYSIQGLTKEYRAKLFRNAVWAYWIYSTFLVASALALVFGGVQLATQMGSPLKALNVFFCGICGTLIGGMLVLNSATQAWRLAGYLDVSVKSMLKAPEGLVPWHLPPFRKVSAQVIPMCLGASLCVAVFGFAANAAVAYFDTGWAMIPFIAVGYYLVMKLRASLIGS